MGGGFATLILPIRAAGADEETPAPHHAGGRGAQAVALLLRGTVADAVALLLAAAVRRRARFAAVSITDLALLCREDAAERSRAGRRRTFVVRALRRAAHGAIRRLRRVPRLHAFPALPVHI